MVLGMDKTIEKSKFGSGFSVYEFGTYESSSVLAGQTCKRFVDSFDTIEEAKAAFPEAKEGFRSANNSFTHLSGPDTFDGQGGVWGDY
jgi:Fe2+ or Zn2+ uptake regulation protein